VQNDIDRDDFRYFLRRRDRVEPIESALYRLLSDLVANRISHDELEAHLDPEILGLLLEEGLHERPELLDEVIDGTLCAVQAEREEVATAPLKRQFREIAAGIVNRVPERKRLVTFGATGLSSRSCEQLRVHAIENREALSDLLETANLSDLESLTDLLVAAVEPIAEMQSSVAQPADIRGVLDSWLLGTPVSDMAAILDADQPEAIARFVEEYAAYLLPWGVTAFMRIASAELGLEPSITARTFPSMLKWGVPTVEATWAHSSGVTSRQLAITLGELFGAQVEDRSPATFRIWLRAQDVDSLAADFDLEGQSLQQTARAVVHSRRSESLQRLEAGNLFPVTASVRLPARTNAAAIRRVDSPPLSLKRDYGSAINRNATYVALGDQPLGYLHWDLSTALGPEIDAGLLPTVSWEGIGADERGAVLQVRIDEPDRP
jgi:hypothetical protein